jgi:hypothetical protein
MARIRSIKPEFPQSETIGRLSRDARLLFIQLWTFVDDFGKARAASRMLASLLYPYDDDAKDLIDDWLDELERENCLIRYCVEGTHYLQITNWLKHQKIDHPSQSKIPDFQENSRDSREDSRALAKDSEAFATDLGPRIRIGIGISNEIPSSTTEAVDMNGHDLAEVKKQKVDDRELILDIVDCWNAAAVAMGLPQVKDITAKRQASIRARVRDFATYGFDDPRVGFQELVTRIRGSPFLTGKSSTGFRADFDFAINSNKFHKIMEGSYETKKQASY